MVMARVLLLLLPLLIGCETIPGYNEPLVIEENNAVWEVRLISAHHAGSVVIAELAFANHSGDAFTVRPENMVLSDKAGNVWPAAGRFPYIGLLRPGQATTVRVGFEDVLVGKQPLYVHPLHKLVHNNPRILMKKAGKIPLDGVYDHPEWDRPK
jgi:hypothetical protein